MNCREKKKGKSSIAPLQPLTLATFRSWGSSAGAGRTDLPMQSYEQLMIPKILADIIPFRAGFPLNKG